MQKHNHNSKFVVQPMSREASPLDLDSRETHHPGLRAQAAPVPENDPDPVPAVGRLADLLSGPLGDLAIQNLRVRPRQTRSIESVERLLAAAAEMTFLQKKAENISIERISNEAGVTPQAAYRYFRDADELVKTGLRCTVIREHERVLTLMSDRVLSDETEMAGIIVRTVIETCERLHRFPGHARDSIFQEYRQMGYDASQLMSEIICKDVDDADIRHSLDVTKTSVALTATIAVATSIVSKGLLPQRGGRLEGMLANLFVGVVQSGGSPADGFWERGDELESYLRAGAR